MDTFNLNSELYNDEEIETLFNLKKPYIQPDILKAKEILLTQLISNKSLGVEKQREISFFIDTISNRITNKIYNNGDKKNKIVQQGSNFLIEDNEKLTKLREGRLAGQGNAPPGFLNPINVRTITQSVNIDSRFRPNYYGTSATNFSVFLPFTQKKVIKMRIASIEVPITYHGISKSNGNSTCLIIDPLTGNCWLVILPDGNYEQSWAGESNAAFIETAMNNAIASATPGIVDITTGKVTLSGGGSLPKINPLKDLCFTLDRISGRSVFAVPEAGSSTTIFTDGFTIRFNVDVDGNLNLETNIQLRLGWQLGFRSGQYICGGGADEDNGDKGAGACLSEGICLTCGPRYGFISIEDYQMNTTPSYIVAYANSILQNNVITRVNLSSVQADVGVYQISNDLGLDSQTGRTREYFGAVDIQKLNITMYDEYGRVINLNNMDWSFTLEFDKLYD
jgi:hypothetical protein